jgi:hypothetical protein
MEYVNVYFPILEMIALLYFAQTFAAVMENVQKADANASKDLKE